MNDINEHTTGNKEKENSKIIQFHTSGLSGSSWGFASNRLKGGIYFVQQMQRLYDEFFHDTEYDSLKKLLIR